MRLLAQALMTTAVVYGMSMKAQTTSGNYTQRTNIPTLYIETTSGKDPVDKKTYLPCTMTYVDGGNVTTYTGNSREYARFRRILKITPH